MRKLITTTSLLLALVQAGALHAGALEQAKRLHDRLAGVPADAATLSQMQTLIEQGNAAAAAEIAMQHPDFYRTTLKLFAARTMGVIRPDSAATATATSSL